jgi:hypothetical protein
VAAEGPKLLSGGFEVWFVTPAEEFKLSKFLDLEVAFVSAAKFLKRIGFTVVSVENTLDFKGGPAIRFSTPQKGVYVCISGGVLTEGDEKTPLEPGDAFTSQIGKALNEEEPLTGTVYLA